LSYHERFWAVLKAFQEGRVEPETITLLPIINRTS